MNFALKLIKLVNTASILVKHAEMISESSTHFCASKPSHMQPAMTPKMTPGKTHLRNVKVTGLKLTRMETFNPFTAYK
jgi:hypothetical protein